MGRGTELFEFLNAEKMPSDLEIRHRYTSLSITEDLKKFRREWRSAHKDELKSTLRNSDGGISD